MLSTKLDHQNNSRGIDISAFLCMVSLSSLSLKPFFSAIKVGQRSVLIESDKPVLGKSEALPLLEPF